MKYKYLFRLGRGKRAADLLGPSISYFWNDIYDGFDVFKELTVKKLDRTEFTEREIRQIAGELFEDMDEDNYLIGTEIRDKELYFYSLGTFEAFDLDEYQKLVEDYFDLFEKTKTVDTLPESRELFFRRIDGTLVGVLVVEYSEEEERVSKSLVTRFHKDCYENDASERLIVTDNEIENGVKKLADSMDIRIKSTSQMRREMNESLLETALDERKVEIHLEKGGRFSLGRFNILLDYVKNARTNVAKKKEVWKTWSNIC